MICRRSARRIGALALISLSISIVNASSAFAQTATEALPAYEIIPTARPDREGMNYAAFKVDRKLNALWNCNFDAAHPENGGCKRVSGGGKLALNKSAIAFMLVPSSVSGHDYWLVNMENGAVSICGTGAAQGGEGDCVRLKDFPNSTKK